jgi:hypothetical protein
MPNPVEDSSYYPVGATLAVAQKIGQVQDLPLQSNFASLREIHALLSRN